MLFSDFSEIFSAKIAHFMHFLANVAKTLGETLR